VTTKVIQKWIKHWDSVARHTCMDCHTHVDTVMACIRTRNRAKHGWL